MVEITSQMLMSIAPQGNINVIDGIVPFLNKYLPDYGIDTLLRLDHFCGQSAEETAGFRTLVEYASGNEYEGREDLGNVEDGDGPRFKGRGIFQITGRSNYKSMSNILKVDLISNPELAATPEIAVRTACEYWKSHNLNAYADQDDINSITKRINGGLTGLSDREIFTDRADNIFSKLFPNA
jgi:putative chitinase